MLDPLQCFPICPSVFLPSIPSPLLIHEGAQWSDVLHGFTHAYLLQHHSAMDPEEVHRIARETAPIFVEKLRRAQWWVGQPLVETNRKERVKVYEE